jgi:hypothetical protein
VSETNGHTFLIRPGITKGSRDNDDDDDIFIHRLIPVAELFKARV